MKKKRINKVIIDRTIGCTGKIRFYKVEVKKSVQKKEGEFCKNKKKIAELNRTVSC